jgi:hypothetical protein
MASKETAEKWISYSDFGQEEFDKYFRHLNTKYGNNQIEIDLPMLLFGKKITLDFFINDVLNGTMSAQEALQRVKGQVL